jgi:hypothetical protein
MQTPPLVFELTATAPPAAAGLLVVGGWTMAPADAGLSYAVPGAATPDAPLWRADFPADDPQQATARLERSAQQMAATQRALPLAHERLLALASHTPPDPAGLSFAGAAGGTLPPAEAELLDTLDALTRRDQAAVSFGFGWLDGLTQGWQEGVQRVRDFAERVMQAAAPRAMVETRTAGRLLCRTSVGWDGDAAMLWRLAPTAQQAALHWHTLDLALAARVTLLNAFSLLVRGATLLARLSATLATPGGALLAIPAVWRFINRIQDEFDA